MNVNVLLIGINYTGTPDKLNGCINDVKEVKKFFNKQIKVPDSNIVTMTDKSDKDLQPYGKNIRRQLIKLANKSKKSDFIFLHYSGHGSNQKDEDGEEKDGKDEVLCPLDYPEGLITDDELYKIFIDKIKCPLIMLLDCCHSGTCGDLKYVLTNKNKFKVDGKNSNIENLQIMISGCRDNQTSADSAFLNDKTNKMKSQGALTKSFLTTIEKLGVDCTILDALNSMKQFLKDNEFDQVPQLTCNKEFPIYEERLIPECKAESSKSNKCRKRKRTK